MKFSEAMKAVDEGQKVYCPSWDGVIKWHLEDCGGTKCIITENGTPGIDFSVYLYQSLGKEWEIYHQKIAPKEGWWRDHRQKSNDRQRDESLESQSKKGEK